MFFRPLFVSNAATLKGWILAISIVVVMLSLYLFNYHRYKNRDEEIKEKYKDCKFESDAEMLEFNKKVDEYKKML
jgi:hypothetical protein